MNERTFNAIRYLSYFCGISMVMGFIYILYYLGKIDTINGSMIHNVLLVFAISSILIMIVFFIWTAKTKMGKKYDKMYSKLS